MYEFVLFAFYDIIFLQENLQSFFWFSLEVVVSFCSLAAVPSVLDCFWPLPRPNTIIDSLSSFLTFAKLEYFYVLPRNNVIRQFPQLCVDYSAIVKIRYKFEHFEQFRYPDKFQLISSRIHWKLESTALGFSFSWSPRKKKIMFKFNLAFFCNFLALLQTLVIVYKLSLSSTIIY